MKSADAYRIAILSPIPVFERHDVFFTIDLWARDLEIQADVAEVDLVCPVREVGKVERAEEVAGEIDQRIHVHSYEKLHENELDTLVSAVDVVQIPGSAGWKGSRPGRRFIKAARRAGKIVILGVSSNRARTAWLNASGKGFLHWIRGLIDYVDIRFSQSWLGLRSDGVFVVGSGVAQLFNYLNRNIHVGIASWVKESEIASRVRESPRRPLRLCIASRLERMKGVHVGVSAVENLVRQHRIEFRLTIIGEGPEKTNLQQQVLTAGLSAITSFLAPLAYPQPFLDVLASMDIVLLTNLNDEQPRLIFDAISRGCLPLCPDAPSYRGLGLDRRLFYNQGNALDLCRAIGALADAGTQEAIRVKLLGVARTFTIDTMHEKRAAWITSLLIAQSASRPMG